MELQIRGLSKSFGDRVVLTNFNATWSAPSTVALMGPSGSGKSTLLSIVSDLLHADAGTVTFGDGSRPQRRDIAWVLQSTPMLTRRTALDNVLLGPRSRGIYLNRSRELARDAMDLLEIGHLASTSVYRLSGGERQRVAVARAIASQTHLILADEPTAALDPASRDRVNVALGNSSRRGALVLIATHDAEVAAACDLTIHLQQAAVTDGRS